MDRTDTTLNFQIASGSVAGRDHAGAGKNNQDAAFWVRTDAATVLLVCDGCSSGKFSEAGALFGARITANAILQRRARPAEDSFEVLEDARLAVLERLRELSKLAHLDGIQELLFTVVGALITPETTTLFSIGDGVVAVNGEVTVIGPFPGNAPPYLAYGLEKECAAAPRFKIHRVLPSSDVQSLLIGTDGVADLIQIADQTLPGRCETVGPLEQFWCEERFFKNADMLRRRLALINRSSVAADWERQSIERHIGLLRDDTTLIVAKREGGSHERIH